MVTIDLIHVYEFVTLIVKKKCNLYPNINKIIHKKWEVKGFIVCIFQFPSMIKHTLPQKS
jgi:hypothetical protein